MSTRGRNGSPVPKIIGADFELSNFFLGGPADANGSADLASAVLLAGIDGVPARRSSRRSPAAPDDGSTPVPAAYAPYPAAAAPAGDLDFDRRFLPGNGGSVYIDSQHLEATTPEVRSAIDFVAIQHAMLRLARGSLDAANARMPEGLRVVCLACNSDGKGHSFGAHMNVSIGRATWDDMFERRLDPALFFLGAFQVSSILFTGLGKVGAENGRPRIPYQISQRADFIETMLGPQTMYRRPLLNARDEPHVAPAAETDGRAGFARLHCIFYDLSLCHTSIYLRAGLLQVVLAMIEAGAVDPALLLESPLDALHTWSADPDLHTRATLRSGARVTAVEHQLLFLEHARRFVDAGRCADAVPDAHGIIATWEHALARFEARDWCALARMFDWVRKRWLLEQAMTANPALDWDAPEIVHLDQAWGSLGDDGLYYACERLDLVDRLVTDTRIEHFVHEPPRDTRAWARAMLLRSFDRDEIAEVDWSFVKLNGAGDDASSAPRTIWLPAPHEGTADQLRRRRTGKPTA